MKRLFERFTDTPAVDMERLSRDVLPNIIDMTLEDLQRSFEAGSLSSLDLVRTCLERIEEVNHQVKAVAELDPTVLDQARTLDAERVSGRVRGVNSVPASYTSQRTADNVVLDRFTGYLCSSRIKSRHTI